MNLDIHLYEFDGRQTVAIHLDEGVDVVATLRPTEDSESGGRRIIRALAAFGNWAREQSSSEEGRG